MLPQGLGAAGLAQPVLQPTGLFNATPYTIKTTDPHLGRAFELKGIPDSAPPHTHFASGKRVHEGEQGLGHFRNAFLYFVHDHGAERWRVCQTLLRAGEVY